MTDIDGEYAVTQPEPVIRKAIRRAKEYLAKNDLSTAIGILYGMPEVEQAGLGNLVYLLDHGEYGRSKGDIEGVIELLELHLAETIK